jgi:LysR family transcriptional regulator, transcriptional activator of nhaA
VKKDILFIEIRFLRIYKGPPMNQQWLNYHHLYYFKVIATEGSIARASKVLRLGQPTLSAQLKLLEDSLGHELFERKNRSLILTESGRVTLEYANEIFKLGRELRETIEERPSKGRVPLQVGVVDTIPKHVSLQLVTQARDMADVIVSVHEGRMQDLVRDLRDHRLDLILLNAPIPATDGAQLRSRKVARMPVVVCGDKKFQPLKRGFPESLNGQPMVLPTSDCQLRYSVEHWLAHNEIKVDVIAEAQDTSLQKLMATHGVGLIAASTPAVDELVSDRELIVLGHLEGVFEEYWIICAERRIQHPVVTKLMKSLAIIV